MLLTWQTHARRQAKTLFPTFEFQIFGFLIWMSLPNAYFITMFEQLWIKKNLNIFLDVLTWKAPTFIFYSPFYFLIFVFFFSTLCKYFQTYLCVQLNLNGSKHIFTFTQGFYTFLCFPQRQVKTCFRNIVFSVHLLAIINHYLALFTQSSYTKTNQVKLPHFFPSAVLSSRGKKD